MKTNEVISLFNTSREALRYYEQQELISPLKGENGYRNYNQADLDTLQLILYLRDLNISSSDIKLVLNDQLSLYECLINKQNDISKELTKNRLVLEKIQMNLNRTRMYFFYKEVPKELEKENILLFEDDKISIQRGDTNIVDIKTLLHSEIDKIEISLCTRFDLVNRKNLYRLILKEYPFGEYTTTYYCHLDFNIYYKNGILKFESYNLGNMKSIFSLLKDHNISIIDPIGLVPIFDNYDDRFTFSRTIERNIRKWAKEYKLDNPRTGSFTHEINDFWSKMIKK